jgi:pyrroloquinoline quinone (PQQ) biosynthesis protein C
MLLLDQLEELFQQQVSEFAACDGLARLEAGRLADTEIDQLLASFVRVHLRSPRFLAFIYALAPPGKTGDALEHNLLEELGVADEIAHPALLKQLANAVGLNEQLPDITAEADAELKRRVLEPLLYGSLRDVGLAALAEIAATEYMLSRLAGRIARAIHEQRGVSYEALAWFTHHAEVDLRHAGEGLSSLIAYIAWYEIPEDDALTLLRMTFRENVFIRRYFGALALARTGS